jgi:hypothetical protein
MLTDSLTDADSVYALAALSRGLEDYRRVHGGLSSAILAQKGAQLIYGNDNPKFGATFRGLAQLFFAESPEPGEISQAARARGFRLGRKIYGGALSPRAMDRARELMGGFKTIIASVNPDTGALNFVRRGVRKARVHYRWGRKSFVIGGDFVGPLPANEKRLNLRAVATVFELRKREQGRRFLGAGWLHKRFRKMAKIGFVPPGTPGLASGWVASRQFGGTEKILVNQNPRSEVKILGLARFEGDEKSGNLGLRISSFIPGVKAIGESRGLFVRAINGVRADMSVYMARKHKEMLSALFDQQLGVTSRNRRALDS